MKTKIYKTLTLAICAVAFSFTTNAQLPDFTLVDTGAIYELRANQYHLSGIVFDADNDGDFDPVIGNSSWDPVSLVLYKNERKGLYKPELFLPETSSAFKIYFTSPTGDIDNDGDSDVIGQKKWATHLDVFINDGYGNFLSDTTYFVPNTLDSFYPVLLDFNKDGYLDLIRFDTAVVVLYNNGEGIFTDKTKIGHYDKGGNVVQHSMSWADVDNDGDMDVYCGMTWGKNIFFLNTGTALEQVEANHITLSESEATHSVNWIDYDNDGDMDLYTVDVLFENLGSMEFEKHIIREGKYDSDSTWSSSRVWGDLDNDGDLDLFVSVENNHLLGDPTKPLSAHPYNLLYLNEGNGNFTNVLNHTLTLHDSHTAEIFDHDNDGDLDVLTIGNGWAENGHNQLFINEGNDNSSILINCVDKHNCATPYGTRIYAKSMIKGEYVSQTREITPVDGNLSFAHTRIHFGLGDADVIDTLIIRWPSGHIDEYLDVQANQFYRAIEDSELGIDFKATNYIQYSPAIADIEFILEDETITIDLNDHYQFIKGDTMFFKIFNNENANVVTASINGNILTLESGIENGDSKIQIIDSTSIAKRMDHFTVSRLVDVVNIPEKQNITAYPNPFNSSIVIEYELKNSETVEITIYNHLGKQVELIEQNQPQGKQQVVWNAEGLPAGIYYCVLKTENGTQTMKMTKLK